MPAKITGKIRISYRSPACFDGKRIKPYQNPRLKKRYFEVLFVDNLSQKEEIVINKKISDVRDPRENFIYQLVYVKSYQDSLIALIGKS